MYWSAAGSDAEAATISCGPSRRSAQGCLYLADLGLLLSDRHVDADDTLTALIDYRVDRHRCLAGLAVADDQLALTSTDRDHRVDRLDAGLERGIYVGAIDHAGGDALIGRVLFG